MDEAQRGGQQGLEANGAIGRFGERLALDLGVLRIVVGMDGVDGTIAQALDDGLAIILAAQGRGELEEGAVAADVVLVEREVIDGNPCRNRAVTFLGGSQKLNRGGAGDLGGVVFDTRETGQLQIARQRNGLGFARLATQAQDGGKQPLVHHAVAGEIGIAQVMHKGHAVVGGIAHGGAQQAGRLDGMAAIGEADDAGFAKQAKFGHLLAAETLGDGPSRQDIDLGRCLGAANEEIDQGAVIDHRGGVGHHDEAGDAAGSGGFAGRGQGFAIFLAGLAGEDAHIDQARRQRQAAGIDDLDMVGHADGLADGNLGDDAVLDQHGAGMIGAGGRIQDAGVFNQRCSGGHGGAHGSFLAGSSASSTAMRTATPISTWSVMTEAGPSAMAGSISTPRFIGPGCMTMASGLA